MNSLYGRLGMSPDVETHQVVDSDYHDNYLNKDVSNVIDLGNGKELISVLDNKKDAELPFNKTN